MDLTILIPTKNRHNHIKKLLKYYNDFNFTGKIFIFDSSDLRISKKNFKFVNRQNNRNISIYKFKAFPFQCFKKFKKLIKTKYVCYSGDDDYFIIEGLEKMLQFLNHSKSAIGVNGTSITLGLAGKNYNEVTSFGIYQNFSTYKNSSIDRLDDLMKKYLVPLFSLFRTKKFVEMLDVVPEKNNMSYCPSRAVNDELLESFYFTFLGKIIHKDYPYLIRTVSGLEKGYKLDHLEHGYQKSYKYLQQKILSKIKNKKDYKIINNKFNQFFKERLNLLKSLEKKSNKFNSNFFITNIRSTFYFKIKLYFFLFRYENFSLFYNVIKWIKTK